MIKNTSPALLLLAALSLLIGTAGAADFKSAAPEVWAGVYQCSAMQSDAAQSPAFTSSVRMVVEGTAATITKESGEIKQTLSGEVKADGALRLEGVGMRRDTSSPGWRYRFDGRFEGGRFQAKGMMFSANLATKLRDCTMTLTRTQASSAPPPAPAAVPQKPPAAAQAVSPAAADAPLPGKAEPAAPRVLPVGVDPLEKELDFTERNDTAVIEGTLARALPHRYIINAKKGQALAATLQSGAGVRFDLYEPGSVLTMVSGGFVVQGARVGATPEGTQLNVELPGDGKYLLLVRAPKDQAAYTVDLAVSRGASSVGSAEGPWWTWKIVWLPPALVLAALVLIRLVRGKRDRRLFRPD